MEYYIHFLHQWYIKLPQTGHGRGLQEWPTLQNNTVLFPHSVLQVWKYVKCNYQLNFLNAQFYTKGNEFKLNWQCKFNERNLFIWKLKIIGKKHCSNILNHNCFNTVCQPNSLSSISFSLSSIVFDVYWSATCVN